MLRSTSAPALLFALATASAFACSATVVQDGPATQPVVRFDGTGNAFMGIPFPSDAYLQSGKVVAIPGMEGVVKQNSSFLQHSLAQMDGFSRTAMSLFYLDDLAKPLDDDGIRPTALVDTASLPKSEAECMADGSSVFLVDLAATDSSRARIPCRAGFHAPKGTKTRPVLGVGPGRGIILEEGHQYAAVVTNRVKTKDGVALGGTSDWTQATTGDRRNPLGSLYGASYDKVKTLLGGALGKDAVVGMTVFTTNKMGQELFALRDQLEDAPAAVLKWDDTSVAPMKAARFAAGDLGPLPAGFTATLDDWLGVVAPTNKLPSGADDPDSHLPVRAHDKIAAAGTAEFDGINYLQVKTLGYEDVEHANFARDAGGKPIPAPEKPTNKIWATFFVPRGTMPATGWPVVILQHGLSSSRSYALDLANVLCGEGWAVVAVDSVTFGARAADPKYQKDDHTNWEKAPGAKYVGGDGIGDPDDKGATNGSFDLFGGLKNIGALRDQLRQAGFDTAQLVKLLRANPDLSPLKTGADAPKIDGDKIAYIGDSLGGIEGAIAAGIEPNVKAWVLNVAGGSLVQELGVHSPVVSNQLNLAGAFNFGFQSDQFTESHLLTTLVQTIEDPGDPLYYASALQLLPHTVKGAATKPRNVLQIEVLFDEVVANESNEALARAAGFPLATPNVGSNSEIRDLKAPDTNAARIVFPEAKPDGSGVIKDVPGTGFTAALIQTAPSQHGADLTTKSCKHEYKAPWANFDTNEPFTHFDTTQQYGVTCPYLETQATVTQFVKTAFAGGAPEIKGFKPPVRDLDGDGTPDATDPDPNDPKVK